MSDLIPNVEEVARKCQRQFEAGTVPQDLLLHLYLAQPGYEDGYRPDARKWIAERVKDYPVRCCILASLFIRYTLGDKGLLADGTFQDSEGKKWGHTMLMVDRTRSTIADITAHQFKGGPSFYIGPLITPWAFRMYRPDPYPLRSTKSLNV